MLLSIRMKTGRVGLFLPATALIFMGTGCLQTGHAQKVDLGAKVKEEFTQVLLISSDDKSALPGCSRAGKSVHRRKQSLDIGQEGGLPSSLPPGQRLGPQRLMSCLKAA